MLNFNMSLPDDAANPYSVPELLRHVARELRINRTPSYISNATLTERYFRGLVTDRTVESKPSLSVQGWRLTKKEIKEHQENYQEFESNQLLTARPLPTLLLQKPTSKLGIGMGEQRLAKAGYPSNAAELLEQVAETIDSLGSVEVTDLVYHDFSDEDTQQHPFVRFYFVDSEAVEKIFHY